MPVLKPGPGARACFNCDAFAPWGHARICDEAGRDVARQPEGQCRRHPPVVQPDGSRETVRADAGIWPVIAADDWCTAFAPRPAASTRGRP